ncbi:hypothetical protein FA95DRAFT_1456278, partial [Auriscalpium vulgare]
FPPDPLSDRLMHRIITDFCEDLSSKHILERSCKVCACLYLKTDLVDLHKCPLDLGILYSPSTYVTRKERNTVEDDIDADPDSVVVKRTHYICDTCYKDLRKNKVPLHALANGNWIGDVPQVL